MTKPRQEIEVQVPPFAPSSPIGDGVDAFLRRFCPRPDLLRPAFERQPRRLRRLHDGEVLCRLDEPASECWLIVDGAIRVEKASYPIWRRKGEMIGEAAFYRPGKHLRGATLSALGDGEVFRIDRPFVDQLSEGERSLWHETIACVLAAKLDEATDHRDRLRRDRLDVDGLLARFVCTEGLEAARAALSEGGQGRIDPESCEAIVWFSDVAGFSALFDTVEPADAGALIVDIMRIQERAVHDHGGQIDKHMGDGLMAFWRCPDDEELTKAANQAVSAALGCARDLVRFFNDRDIRCDVRIGLHGGRVIFGDFGGLNRIAFTVIGKPVNEASRYEQVVRCSEDRPLGRVRISPAIFDHIRDGPARQAFGPEVRRFHDKHERPFEVFSSND